MTKGAAPASPNGRFSSFRDKSALAALKVADAPSEKPFELPRLRDENRPASHGNKVLSAELGQGPRQRFTGSAKLGSEDAFCAVKFHHGCLVAQRLGAALKQPARKARLHVFKPEVVEQAHQRLEMTAHGPQHADGEFGSLAQQFQERRFRNQKYARRFDGACIRRVGGVLGQSRFRKAFARTEKVDDLDFAGRVHPMDIDGALVHDVKTLGGRTFAEKVSAFFQTFLDDEGRDPLQIFGREFRKKVTAAKRLRECGLSVERCVVGHDGQTEGGSRLCGDDATVWLTFR
jgi:hypothetical protein